MKVDAPSRGCIVESEDEEDKDEDDITTTTSLNSKYGGYGSNLHRNADRVLMWDKLNLKSLIQVTLSK